MSGDPMKPKTGDCWRADCENRAGLKELSKQVLAYREWVTHRSTAEDLELRSLEDPLYEMFVLCEKWVKLP